MNFKLKLGLALLTSTLGATMIAGGSFALFTAQAANNGNSFTAGTVKLTASSEKVFAGTKYFQNLAPGDTESGTLTITNSGTLDEWVGLEHTLTGDLFANYDHSVDADAGWWFPQSGPGSWFDFYTDYHPLQISYRVQVYDNLNHVTNTLYSLPFSNSDKEQPKLPFKLPVGYKAVVTYMYQLPLEAHNDYQGKTGQLDVEVDAVQVRNNDKGFAPKSWQPEVE